jgi:hypothetical protein
MGEKGVKKQQKLWVNTKYAHLPLASPATACFHVQRYTARKPHTCAERLRSTRVNEIHSTLPHFFTDVPTLSNYLAFTRKLRKRNISCMDEMMGLLACFKRCNFEDDRKCAGEKKKLDDCLIFAVSPPHSRSILHPQHKNTFQGSTFSLSNHTL